MNVFLFQSFYFCWQMFHFMFCQFQLNLCMSFTEITLLPVYNIIYHARYVIYHMQLIWGLSQKFILLVNFFSELFYNFEISSVFLLLIMLDVHVRTCAYVYACVVCVCLYVCDCVRMYVTCVCMCVCLSHARTLWVSLVSPWFVL